MEVNIANLIDSLSIVNCKMFDLCNRKSLMARNPGDYTKEELARTMSNDVALCTERARLKNQINKFFNQGNPEEVKDYGS